MTSVNGKEINKSTDLSKHERDGSILKPPFSRIPNMQTSSWIDERLPEMLWAILLLEELGRENALEVFRNVGYFVKEEKDLSNITISGISSWDKVIRNKLFSKVFNTNDIKEALKPLLLFKELPAIEDWKFLGSIESSIEEKKLAIKLTKSIAKVLWHQSEEATDCRWAWVLAQILSGKLSVPREMFENITQYPNKGDMRKVRPTIRASEIGMHLNEKKNNWPEKFWLTCHQNTLCLPIPRDNNYNEKVDLNLLIKDIRKIKIELISHFIIAEKNSNIDYKHSVIFGSTFYVLRLICELTATNLWKGATSRLILRSIAEVYITCSYLIKNDTPDTWRGFREYGSGKVKQSYLKLRDLTSTPSFVNIKLMEEIANEDKWEEFVSIELGHWDKTNLREMSEDAKCKEVYDKYYDWTSAYTHGNWGAIRESVIDKCFNPLHRLHIFPSMVIHKLPSAIHDAIDLTNQLLDLLESQYPNFPLRLNVSFDENDKTEKETNILLKLWENLIKKIKSNTE